MVFGCCIGFDEDVILMNWFVVVGVVGLFSIIGGGLCMNKSLIEFVCCVCIHTNGFNVIIKDVYYVKG